MKKKDWFDCDEYNSFSEYKKYDAVEYYAGLEGKSFNESLKVEEASSVEAFKVRHASDEVEPDSKKQADEKKQIEMKKQAESQSLVKRIVENTTGIAASVSGAAVTAVAAVALCTTFFDGPPDASIVINDRGMDYVSYTLDVNNMQEDKIYYLKITNNGFEYQIEVPSVGTYSDIVPGLKPYYEYSIKLIGESGEVGGNTTYLSKSFYTKRQTTPEAAINFDYIDVDALGFDTYVSDYYGKGETYYLNVIKDDKVIETFNNFEDGHIKGYVYDMLPGDYTFNVYGNFLDGDKDVLVGSKKVSAPFEIKRAYVTDYNITNVGDEIKITGALENVKKAQALTCELEYSIGDTFEYETVKLDDVTSDFEITSHVPDGADSVSASIYLNSKLAYVSKQYILSLPEVTNIEINNINVLAFSAEIINEISSTTDISYKILYHGDEEIIHEGQIEEIESSFTIEDEIPLFAESFDLTIYYKDKEIYSLTNESCMVSLAVDETESVVFLEDGMMIYAKFNKPYEGVANVDLSIHLEGETEEYELEKEITDGEILLEVECAGFAIDYYSYKITVDEEVLYESGRIDKPEEMFPYTYTKLEEAELSIDENGKIRMVIPTTFDNGGNDKFYLVHTLSIEKSNQEVLSTVSNENGDFVYEGLEPSIGRLYMAEIACVYEGHGLKKIISTETDFTYIEIEGMPSQPSINMLYDEDGAISMGVDFYSEEAASYQNIVVDIKYDNGFEERLEQKPEETYSKFDLNAPMDASQFDMTITVYKEIPGLEGYAAFKVYNERNVISKPSVSDVVIYYDPQNAMKYRVTVTDSSPYVDTICLVDGDPQLVVYNGGFGEIELPVTGSEIELELYIANSSGELISRKTKYTLPAVEDFTLPNTDGTHMLHPAPGEATVIRNDDGSATIKLNTDFETDDPSIFYVVEIKSYSNVEYIVSTDKVFTYELEHVAVGDYYVIIYYYGTYVGDNLVIFSEYYNSGSITFSSTGLREYTYEKASGKITVTGSLFNEYNEISSMTVTVEGYTNQFDLIDQDTVVVNYADEAYTIEIPYDEADGIKFYRIVLYGESYGSIDQVGTLIVLVN